MQGRELLMARMLYGTGMRLNELLHLRVQEVQLDRNRASGRGLRRHAGSCVRDPYVYLAAQPSIGENALAILQMK